MHDGAGHQERRTEPTQVAMTEPLCEQEDAAEEDDRNLAFTEEEWQNLTVCMIFVGMTVVWIDQARTYVCMMCVYIVDWG